MDYRTIVELLAITPDAENLCEKAGRLCYASGDKQGLNDKWLQNKIKLGHLSLIEHGSATFYIKASRIFTHQLVRHRIASYSQKSLRYVKEKEPNYVLPPEIKEHSNEALVIYKQAMENAWRDYNRLLELGLNADVSRYVLPHSCSTEIIATWNFRELLHIIELRTSKHASKEMQEVANKIKAIMKEQCPKIFGDL